MMRQRSERTNWSEQFTMRPSIARMTLDLDYGEMDMDDTAKEANQIMGTVEALQHRLTELLVFEIRQDGATQFKTLSVRALYKYVIKAITVGTTEKRAGMKGPTMGSHENRRQRHTNRVLNGKGGRKNNNNNEDKEKDGNESDSSSDSSDDKDQKDRALLGKPKKQTTTTTTTTTLNKQDSSAEEKSVSFGGPEGPVVTEHPPKIPGVPIANEEDHRNGKEFETELSDGTLDEVSIEDPPVPPHETHGPVTYRERLGGYLHPRDMRRLVTPFSASNEPELIVRRHVMLLNFDPLRAVILRDRLLVLVPDGADSILVDLEKRVKGGTKEVERSIFGEASNITPHESMTDIGDSQHSRQSGTGTDIGESQHSRQSGKFGKPSMKGMVKGSVGMVKGSVSLLKKANDTLVVKPIRTLHDRGGNIIKSSLGGGNSSGGTGSDNDSAAGISQTEMDSSMGELQEWEEMESRGWINLPFELQCLDAVLGTVCAILGKDAGELRTNSISAMDGLLHKGTGQGEEILRHMKNSVKEMTSRVKGFIRAMNLVLDETEDMALMNLSRILTHPDRFIQPVPEEILNEESDEPELILEAHLQTSFSLTNSLDLIRGEIQTTQELINQRLDAVRNRLLLANMIISVLSLCVALGSFIGSLFGMNVTNHMETDPDAFSQIVISTVFGIFGMLLLFGAVLWYAGTLPNIRSSF